MVPLRFPRFVISLSVTYLLSVLSAMSAVLDTRMPVSGKTSRVMLNAATVHDQAAIGLSAVGLFEYETKRIWDYSLGVATSSGETISKASLGFSW